MQEITVSVESIPQVASPTVGEGRRSKFSLNAVVFLLVLVGLHLFLRAMGWMGQVAILVLLPVGYAAYYFVRSWLLLYFYHYQLSLIALCTCISYLLIGVKLQYEYHNLLLALVFLIAFNALIRGGFGQFKLNKEFQNKLHKLILITALVQLIPNPVLLKYYHDECVLWHEHLTWQDFQAAPDTTSIYSARISTSLFYKANQAYNYPQAVVWTAMDPKESWCVAEDRDGVYGQFLLDHEQLHFDITEVWRRKTSDSVAKVWG